MRYHFIERQKKAYPITLMCAVLEVSKTGYYNWRQRRPTRRALSNQQLEG